MASAEVAVAKAAGPARAAPKMGGLARPDERKHQETVDKIDRRIVELRGQIDGIRRDLDDKQGGRDEYNKARNDYRGQLDELVVKINALEAERKGIDAKLNESKVKSQEARQGALRLRKTLGYSTVEEIDGRIAHLENEMMISSYSLREEKKLMQEIAQLKTNRPVLARTNAAGTAADPGQSLLPLKTQMQEITKQLDVLYEQKKGILGKRSKMMQDRTAAQGPVKELADQRMSFARELQEEERNRRKEFDRFKRELREYEQKEHEVRKTQTARAREEKARVAVSKKVEDVEKQLESVDDFPFDSEVTLLCQMKKYINRIRAEKEGVEPAGTGELTRPNTGASGVEGQSNGSAGVEGALQPKRAREEFFYAPKEKKDKKKAQAHKDSKTHKPKLVFDIDTLAMFRQFEIETPTTSGDFETCLKQIDQKLAEFNVEKVKYEATIQGRRMELNKQLAELNSDLAKMTTEAAVRETKEKEEKKAEKADPITES